MLSFRKVLKITFFVIRLASDVISVAKSFYDRVTKKDRFNRNDQT
jgi:hypothetical protein